MTDEQINTAIAEACGWKLEKHFWLTPEGCEAYGWDIPNYCNDLNEMHLAESILTTNQYMRFSDRLYDAEQERLKQTKRWRWLSVTARQRAEAFLRTLGKWDDQSGERTEKEDVEDFAESEEDTTLICVLRLLARYHHMEADCMYDAIKDEKERNEAV